MAGQKFEYDDSGGTFFYFLLSFLALILIPGTYYWWPDTTGKHDERRKKTGCSCERCQEKAERLVRKSGWRKFKKYFVRFLLILGWLAFAAVVYKITTFDYEYANFDPYEILGVELSATSSEIKKAYRKLSLIYHPDKETGDEKKFMKLTKAYQALTDETARRNWELYGNPDGPGAMSFGIALPSWIIEKENSIWVLGLYGLVFMVALPTVVGMWWYRSIRYSGDQVLLDTTQLYYYYFHKTPNMMLKRVLMILGASFEFEKRHNSEVKERPSDNEEVPVVIKQLENININNKERPLCYPYSVKARVLLYAHLNRLPLPKETLDEDRLFVAKKCPYLIQEMVTCVSQLMMLAYAGRIQHNPSLCTIESCMKLCPLVVQALKENDSHMLQLPHMTRDMLRHAHKKKHIRNLQQLALMPERDRRAVLQHLPDDLYNNVVEVLKKLPFVEFQVSSEVLDDEESTTYTAGAIVTVTVNLIRQDMEIMMNKKPSERRIETLMQPKDEPEREVRKEGKNKWQKNKKKGGQFKKQKQRKGQMKNQKRTEPVEEVKEPRNEIVKEVDSDRSTSDDDSNPKDKDSNKEEDEDAEWEKIQKKLVKREKFLEGKSKDSHSVHCPFYPEDKQEYWWVYVCDRKRRELRTAPYFVTNLVEEEECQLKFTAPSKPGSYVYTVVLRSDSYIGFDQEKELRFYVQDAEKVPTDHPQWQKIEDEEEEEDKDEEESEYGSESDIDDIITDDDD